MRGERPSPAPLTLSELVDEYLEQHVAEANTIRALRDRLKLATDGIPVKPRATEREHGLGAIRVDRLDARTVGAWRKRLPEGSAWHAHKALRQVLGYAVRTKLVAENVAQARSEPGAEAPRGARVRSRGRSSSGSPASWHPSGARCRSSSPAPACGPRSGSRSSGATST